MIKLFTGHFYKYTWNIDFHTIDVTSRFHLTSKTLLFVTFRWVSTSMYRHWRGFIVKIRQITNLLVVSLSTIGYDGWATYYSKCWIVFCMPSKPYVSRLRGGAWSIWSYDLWDRDITPVSIIYRVVNDISKISKNIEISFNKKYRNI